MKIITETIRIGLVDKHRLVQNGMKALLSNKSNIEVAFTASNSAQCLERIVRYGADLLLIDFDQDFELGFQMVSDIRKMYPRLPLLILDDSNNSGIVPRLMRIGVNGYLLKDIDVSTLIEAIGQVNNGGLYYEENVVIRPPIEDDSEKAPESRNSRMASLTNRENEVLKLILNEHTTQEIAEFLQLSPHTVETHRKNLLVKTGSRNTAGLVRFAMHNNILV
ncbi:MAG: response regulator [Bacteroidetes bacterium]|nr:response regulator [Bacteroidota bacterium]